MLYQKYGFHSSNSVLFDFASSSLQSSPLLSSSIPTPQQDRENERFQHQIIIIFKLPIIKYLKAIKYLKFVF